MILMPTGVLMPVESMSIRVLMGMVQALVRPGNWMALSSSSTSVSMVMPSRHSDSGFSVMVVSIMLKGAGSVAVSARPIFPKVWCTSGNEAIIRSVCWSSSLALVMEMPGKVVGMYNRSPSFRGGMNSDPMRLIGIQVTARTTTAATRTMAFFRSTILMMGW
jgi:hypothetical protein